LSLHLALSFEPHRLSYPLEFGVSYDAERGRSNGLEQSMLRRLFCAGATILLITGTAGAQSNSETQSPLSMPFKPKEPPPTQEQIERQKAADKAYEAVARQEVVRRSMGRRSSRQEQAIAARLNTG
jgi:hypothetical protein